MPFAASWYLTSGQNRLHAVGRAPAAPSVRMAAGNWGNLRKRVSPKLVWPWPRLPARSAPVSRGVPRPGGHRPQELSFRELRARSATCTNGQEARRYRFAYWSIWRGWLPSRWLYCWPFHSCSGHCALQAAVRAPRLDWCWDWRISFFSAWWQAGRLPLARSLPARLDSHCPAGSGGDGADGARARLLISAA